MGNVEVAEFDQCMAMPGFRDNVLLPCSGRFFSDVVGKLAEHWTLPAAEFKPIKNAVYNSCNVGWGQMRRALCFICGDFFTDCVTAVDRSQYERELKQQYGQFYRETNYGSMEKISSLGRQVRLGQKLAPYQVAFQWITECLSVLASPIDQIRTTLESQLVVAGVVQGMTIFRDQYVSHFLIGCGCSAIDVVSICLARGEIPPLLGG